MNTQTSYFKKALVVLMAVMMMFTMMPSMAWAAEDGSSIGNDLGKVYVTIENTTYTSEGAPWKGSLLNNTEVALTANTTMMSAIEAALNNANYSYTSNGTYISKIYGLEEQANGSASGWMGTLNDWFVNKSFAEFKVSDNTLCDGDIIRVMYTSKGYGSDLGAGTYDNEDTAISSLSVINGSIAPEFSSNTNTYTVTMPQGTTNIKVNAAAKYKSHQVYLFVDETEYRRNASIPVSNGTIITVRCGDGNIATTYTITVKIEGALATTVPVTGVSLNHSELTLETGGTASLLADVKPEKATNRKVNWSSSDESVATVAANGVVTAVSAGETTITATTDDGGFKANCKVTVTEPAPVLETVTIKAPSGSTISFGTNAAYSNHKFINPISVLEEEGCVSAVFPLPINKDVFYRVQNPNGVTYWNFGTWNESQEITVTAEDLYIGNSEFKKDTQYREFEKNIYDVADIYLNINEKGYLPLDVGETKEINAVRNWQAVESFMNAKIAVPDIHYEVIDINGAGSDIVEIEPNPDKSVKATLTAKKAGTAIVLVTYDAMTHKEGYGGTQFSAIWPENTGVFVVTVGSDGTSINTNMTINEGMNKASGKVAVDKLDSEHDVLYYTGDEGAIYSFTPESGCDVSVMRPTISNGKISYSTGFTKTGVSVDITGKVTLTGLVHGTNIVKITKEDVSTYQLIRAKKAEVVIKDSTGKSIENGGTINAGETLTITYNGIYNPAEKLSGIYNFTARLFYVNEDGTTTYNDGRAESGTYTFAHNTKNRTFKYEISDFAESGTLTLNGGIAISAYGQAVGTHRTKAGTEADLNALYRMAQLGKLPTVTLQIKGAGKLTDCKISATDGKKELENVKYKVSTDKGESVSFTGNDFKVPAGTYYVEAFADGYVVLRNKEITVSEDGENKFTVMLEEADPNAWDGESFSAPKKDQNGVWQISTAEELYWYVKECNAETISEKNAVLSADIELAGHEFTAIDKLTDAIFDGQGHSINNFYAKAILNTETKAANIGGFINTLSGVVKDFTINGEFEVYTNNIKRELCVGAIAGTISKSKKIGEGGVYDCTNNVTVSVKSLKNAEAAINVAGIIGCVNGGTTIRDCVNDACIDMNVIPKDETKKFANAAGIAGKNIKGTIEQCANYGNITVRPCGGYTAGIASQALYNGTKVRNCYNIGIIDAKSHFVSGIVGSSTAATIENCYNFGEIKAEAVNKDSTPAIAAISFTSKRGLNPSTTYKNNYYLKSSVPEGCTGAVLGKADSPMSDSVGAILTQSKEQFENGTVLNLLNGENGSIYGQRIGKDAYPIFQTVIDEENFEEIYKTTGDYLTNLASRETPSVNSINGEWLIIGLARSGRDVPDGYAKNVASYVKDNINAKEQLHRYKATENARVILALTSAGYDITDVNGHNLLKALTDMNYICYQGNNGPIWTLIALDSHNYAIPSGSDATREALVKEILDAQMESGAWGLTKDATEADSDMTAMALQAIAPYYKNNDDVKSVVDKALSYLSAIYQGEGFVYQGNKSSETYSQVVVALTALGINLDTDDRFIKNGKSVLSVLCDFYVEGGGFKHLETDAELNAMATEQAYYALASYARLLDNKTGLYDMTDVSITKKAECSDLNPGGGTVLPGKNFGLRADEIAGYVTVSFEDRGIRVENDEFSDESFKKALGTIIDATSVPYRSGDTIADVTLRLLDAKGYTYKFTGSSKNSFYLASIKGAGTGNKEFGEYSGGKKSGWMITQNNWFINKGTSEFKVSNGDVLKWQYTCQLGKDIGDPHWDEEEVKDVTTDTKSGTTTAPTEVKVSEKTNADGTKTKVADVKVSADNQKEILKQAKASKSKEIILNVSSKSVGDATKADVTLDKSFIDSIVKDTNAKLTIKTPFGDKTYTQDELKAMSEAATGSTVTVAIEKAAEEPTDDAAAKIAKAKSIVKDMKLVARSAKTAKKNVKVTTSLDKQDKAIIKELKEAGYTVKYRFYRSTKKAAGYKAAVTKKTASYTNTSGKKGTKYFYKVQVRVYDENGKLVAKTALKQCKYASRTWTKAK